VPSLTDAAKAALMHYPFPGNVRELENILERALALMEGPLIDASDLSLAPEECDDPIASGNGGTLQDLLDTVERQKIVEALAQTNGNRTAAARQLGITFRSIRYRMARLGISE
jgi:two-component system response regulator PilR (NtrC family)